MTTRTAKAPRKATKKRAKKADPKKRSSKKADDRDPLEVRPDDVFADRISDVAQILHVGARQVSVWFSQGLQRPEPGERYNVSAIRRWVQEFQKHDPKSKSAAAEEAYRRVKTERELLKLRRERGELVELDAVEECLEIRARLIRRGLENVIDRLPQSFPEIRVRLEDALRKEFDRLMSGWSEQKLEVNEAPGADDGDGSAERAE